MSKTVYLLFGEMGCGKTHVGRVFANRIRADFWDGDEAVTEEMLRRIERFLPMNKEMIDRFTSKLITKILDRANKSRALVVSQALYSDENRKLVIKALKANGCKVYPYWIRCSALTNIRQLFSRERGIGWVWYWFINKPFFEKPTHYFKTYHNRPHLKETNENWLG